MRPDQWWRNPCEQNSHTSSAEIGCESDDSGSLDWAMNMTVCIVIAASRRIPMVAQGAEFPPREIPEYLERAAGSFEGRMVALPAEETIPFKADTNSIIGFYSR